MLLAANSAFGCPWLCSPHGPDAPFSNPALIVIDGIRVLAVLCSLGVVVTSILGSRWATAGAQHSRFVALAAFSMAAATTEIVHLGDYASYRLALNIAGCLLGLWGNVSFLRDAVTVRR